MLKSTEDIKTYFVTIPAHKFLHVRNYESIGYWDFRQKQSLIPGQDYENSGYCLDTTPGRLGYLYHNPEWYWKYVRPVRKL